MSINDRFDEIISNLFNRNKSAFATAVGVSPTVIENVVGSRKGKPSFDVIEKICANANISPDWLITGKGPMIKEELNGCKTENRELLIREPIQSFGRKCIERKYEEQRVPLYNIRAIAGLVPLFSGQYTQTVEQFIEIPNAPKCDGAIHVTGDSMYPIIKAGDIIMYKEIHDIPDNIFYGEMYLLGLDIEGDEMITIKYIQKSEKQGFIKLVSQNQHHQDRDIEISRIRALAFVKASIRFNHIK